MENADEKVEHVVDMAFDAVEKQYFQSKPASPSPL
jgi:hypothetical protein